MIDSFPGRTMPDGSSASLYVLPSITSVWPALWPPWNRTTTSAPTDSQSTILPFPSSPHWAPTTTTLAIEVALLVPQTYETPADSDMRLKPGLLWKRVNDRFAGVKTRFRRGMG